MIFPRKLFPVQHRECGLLQLRYDGDAMSCCDDYVSKNRAVTTESFKIWTFSTYHASRKYWKF